MEFTNSDREQLSEWLAEWIEANDYLLDAHVEPGGCVPNTNVHLLYNSLPWHRMHLRQIEAFLMRKPGGSKFVPLPMWRPASNGTNNIPAYFDKTYKGETPDPALNSVFSFSYNTNFDSDICNITFPTVNSANRFAVNYQEYHNDGHASVGGLFEFGCSPEMMLFWLFHADNDELWYNWEHECPTHHYNVYPVDPDNPVVSINSNVTWSSDSVFVKGIIEIQDGAKLTIPSGTKVRFRSSDYHSYETKIVVKPGGTLEVDGGILTGTDYFGYAGLGLIDRGLGYFEGWKGIEVQGTFSKRGKLILSNGARIEHASLAIDAGTHADLEIEDAQFYNNRRSVKITGNRNAIRISNTAFINNAPLRDVIWKAYFRDPFNVEYEEEHHRDHCVTHSSEVHLELVRCDDIEVHNCTFNNTYIDPHLNNASRGIFSSDSHVRITGSTFTKMWQGVQIYNSGSGPRGRVHISDGCEFTNNKFGVHAVNADFVMIEDSEFSLVNPVESILDEDEGVYDCPQNHGHGIRHDEAGAVAVRFSSGSSAYTIRHNVFEGGGASKATMAIRVGPVRRGYSHVMHNNTFYNFSHGIQVAGAHTYLQMPCNGFWAANVNVPKFYMGVEEEASVPDQGSDNRPVGSYFDACILNSQFYHANTNEAIDYFYFQNTNHILHCHTSNITANNTGATYSSMSGYCDKINHCFNVPPKQCYWDEVKNHNDLIGDVMGNMLMTLGEKLREVNILKTEMMQIAYEGIHRMLDSMQITDALDFMDSVAIYVPDITLDRDILAERMDTALVLTAISGRVNFLYDSGCAGCDTSALFDYLAGLSPLPDQVVYFLEPDTLAIRPVKSNEAISQTQVRIGSERLRVWPNPAENGVYIESPVPVEWVRIVSLTGVVSREIRAWTETAAWVRLDGMAPGIYLLEYKLPGDRPQTEKLVIR